MCWYKRQQGSFAWLLIGSLALNAFFMIALLFTVYKKGGAGWLANTVTELVSPSEPRKSYSEIRSDIFKGLPLGSNQIIFTGDSILDFGEWHELLEHSRIRNRAIAGDGTADLLARIEPIASSGAAHVILEVGINSLLIGRDLSQIKYEYETSVRKLLTASARPHIWVLPVFPINNVIFMKQEGADRLPDNVAIRSDVDAFNAFLAQLPTQMGSRVHFVEVLAVLNGSGTLAGAFSLDGVHLNGRGLTEVAKRLMESIPDLSKGENH
ncbi:MAG: GDSL-type esterase/lipase family protein [Mariprofundaceae bacterium]